MNTFLLAIVASASLFGMLALEDIKDSASDISTGSTIGGTHVPVGLDCEEDAVISWLDVDTLGCVHIDNFEGGPR